MGTLATSRDTIEDLLHKQEFEMLSYLGVNQHVKKEWKRLPREFRGIGLYDLGAEQFNVDGNTSPTQWGRLHDIKETGSITRSNATRYRVHGKSTKRSLWIARKVGDGPMGKSGMGKSVILWL